MFNKRKKTEEEKKEDLRYVNLNSARTYNVRRQSSWASLVLHNIREDDVISDYDPYDNQQKFFFECDLPVLNNSTFFGPTEVPPDGEIVGRKFMKSSLQPSCRKKVPIVKMEVPVCPNPNVAQIDVIQLSDDEVVDKEILVVKKAKETCPCNIKLIRKLIEGLKHKRKIEKLSHFIEGFNLGESTTQEIEEESARYENGKTHVMKYLKDDYVSISTDENRRKISFILKSNDSISEKNLMDLIDKPQSKHIIEKQKKNELTNKDWMPKRARSPSPICVEFSSDDDDDAPLVKKNTEDKGAPKMGVIPAGDSAVSKNGHKVRSANVNDHVRKTGVDEHKKTLVRTEKERKERRDGVMVTGINKTKKEDNGTYRIPRKETIAPSSIDIGEPSKKKIRPTLLDTTVDIIGVMMDAMDARNAGGTTNDAHSENMSPRKHGEEWTLPRYDEPRVLAPTVPSRFGMKGDDDDMDICMSSSDMSINITQSSDERIEMEKHIRIVDDVQLRKGGSNDSRLIDSSAKCIEINAPSVLLTSQAESEESMLSRNEARYRLTEVDNVKSISQPVNRSLDVTCTTIKNIPIEDNELISDPRIPAPSPTTLSKWKSTRVQLNMNEEDAKYEIAKNEKGEDIIKMVKKGVKWGENATKEFNPNDDIVNVEDKVDAEDDENMKLIDKKEENGEVCITTGQKEVGGRKYNIVKKVVLPPEPIKSCLKPSLPSLSLNGSTSMPPPPLPCYSNIPPPKTPPLTPDDIASFPHMSTFLVPPVPPPLPPQPIRIVIPDLSTIGISTNVRLPDFVPPPGFESDGTKVDDEKKEKERKEKEEREKKQREERDKIMRNDNNKSNGSSPDIMYYSSSINMRDSGKINQGASCSSSMVNLSARSSGFNTNGGTNVSASLSNTYTGGITSSRSFEIGSEIIGDKSSMRMYKTEEVKHELELRTKIIHTLKVHKILEDDSEREYPHKIPTHRDQMYEQENNYRELSPLERNWKTDGIQPVWLQSLPLKTHFSFKDNAGLYWPIVQATDKISEKDENFESIDVLRSLGNNTYFATEKKALVGMEARLPNGMTHKERFESFYNPKEAKPEGRFKNRRMYSRVFSNQSEDEARIIHNKKMEEERELLRDHEETIMKNAPKGVSIELFDKAINRPAGFRDFPNMIQYYRTDEYEYNPDVPFQNPAWYSNDSQYYMPYSERVNYLCHVINHYNQSYNSLYDVQLSTEWERKESMIALDMTAFAASQISLGRMEGWKRVGLERSVYIALMKKNKARIALMESESFSLEKYIELSRMDSGERLFFHNIIDWLNSTFKVIKPISEWGLSEVQDSSFREVIIEKKDENGEWIDTRRAFFDAFRSYVRPPPAKRPNLRYD